MNKVEEEARKNNGIWTAKNASLFALVLQQVGLVMMIRYSRTTRSTKGDEASTFIPYLTSTAVVSAEVLKIALNILLELVLESKKEQKDEIHPLRRIGQGIFHKESLKLLVPALAYVIQNNLLFVALSNLSVPVYQVTNQGKLLTTAVCSRFLLNKSISGMQYVSLAILAAGVALVQLSGMDQNKTSINQDEDQNELLGFVAVIISCFMSGFAGVYFEKMLKAKNVPGDPQQQQVSVYMRNVQLALWSVMFGLVPVIGKDWRAIQQNGFFQGYNGVVWGVIVCQAMTGLIVALVMKYADTILKGFATSVAVVVATVLSVFVWKTHVDGFFLVGASLVVLAVRIYTNSPAQQAPSQQDQQQPKQQQQHGWASSRKTWLAVLVFGGMLQVAAMLATHQSLLPEQQESPDKLDMLTRAALEKVDAPQCHVRDVSNYSPDYDDLQMPKGKTKTKWEQCLRFQCTTNQTMCDNFEPTNFDGPDPPCCVHILRDLAREFDHAMCYLGLEYFPAFGMLLGLTRADRLIPWTIDNDYISTIRTMAAMEELWDTASHLNHGVGFHWDLVYRLCATPDFADGKLLRWKVNETKSWYADSVYPFADIFTAEEKNETTVIDQRECYHDVTSLRPQVRRAVYNGTFFQNFPRNPDALLTEYFGPTWKVPDAKKSSHGGTHCGRRRSRENVRKKQAAKKKAAEAKKATQ